MISEGRRFDPDLEHFSFAFKHDVLLSYSLAVSNFMATYNHAHNIDFDTSSNKKCILLFSIMQQREAPFNISWLAQGDPV